MIFNAQLGAVGKDNSRIVSIDVVTPVAARDSSTSSSSTIANSSTVTTTVKAGVFIDASYEGDLMAATGVLFVTGREAVSEYNESLAG